MYLFREFSQGPFSSTVFYELITKAKKICFRTAFAASCFSVKLMYGILVEGTSDVYEKRLFKHFLLLWKVHTLIVISLCLSYKGTVIEIVTLLCIILEKKKKKKTLKVKCLYTAFKYFKGRSELETYEQEHFPKALDPTYSGESKIHLLPHCIRNNYRFILFP